MLNFTVKKNGIVQLAKILKLINILKKLDLQAKFLFGFIVFELSLEG